MNVTVEKTDQWQLVGESKFFAPDGGMAIKVHDKQIAIFNFSNRDQWFACDNLCPHKKQNVLARGLLGDLNGIPKVACPMHKKTFSLQTGECLNDIACQSIQIYPIKEENGKVYISFIKK